VYSVAFWLAATLPVVVVHAPHAALTLEVARTGPDREYGLMNRSQIAPHTGMIFVFDGDGPVAFWMKNTRVPLDMVFISADGTVRRVYGNVAVVSTSLPDADIPREAGVGKYVIELPAGEASKDGIAAGVRLDLRDVPSAS
jgi:uncharacterized membrane protein (UPF0127 family)